MSVKKSNISSKVASNMKKYSCVQKQINKHIKIILGKFLHHLMHCISPFCTPNIVFHSHNLKNKLLLFPHFFTKSQQSHKADPLPNNYTHCLCIKHPHYHSQFNHKMPPLLHNYQLDSFDLHPSAAAVPNQANNDNFMVYGTTRVLNISSMK